MDHNDGVGLTATCPRDDCKEPNVQPGNVWDGKRFYRCHRCAWSWFTVAIRRTDDKGA